MAHLEDSPGTRSALQGRLIRLRAYEPTDAARLNDLFNDPDVLAGILVPFPQPMSGFSAWLESNRANDEEANFAIETLEGEAVGGCALRGLGIRARTANLGIWIAKPFWNRGYGTDAVRTLCRFGFEHMNLHRIELEVFDSNPRGRRVYERVGFKLEGTMRQKQFVGGRYVDEHMMGLLAGELVDDPSD